jgi:RNA polymerase-associated protein CTR9
LAKFVWGTYRILLSPSYYIIGQARILYARRQHSQALKLFQRVLLLNPRLLPDPRIGIGLCLWALGHHAKAKAAWQRSVEVVCPAPFLFCPFVPAQTRRIFQNPGEWPAQLLLGLEAINSSKQQDPNNFRSEEECTRAFVTGTKMVEKAFNANQRSASAANALCELFLRKGNHSRVSSALFYLTQIVLVD